MLANATRRTDSVGSGLSETFIYRECVRRQQMTHPHATDGEKLQTSRLSSLQHRILLALEEKPLTVLELAAALDVSSAEVDAALVSMDWILNGSANATPCVPKR